MENEKGIDGIDVEKILADEMAKAIDNEILSDIILISIENEFKIVKRNENLNNVIEDKEIRSDLDIYKQVIDDNFNHMDDKVKGLLLEKIQEKLDNN